jgi:DedD protein
MIWLLGAKSLNHKSLNRKFQESGMSDQDSEITLGTGRLLGLFFGLVILCALFFSVGFSLGRKTSAGQVASAAALPVPIAATTTPKPSPSRPDAKPDCATPGNCPPQPASASTSDELTFYKAVEQNDAKPQLEAAAPAGKAAEPPKPAPEIARSTALGTGYMVQVAAVSKQEDADALVSALRKKSYPVITTSNPPADKLFHVQVGPFPDVKDAEATRAKLIGDGYNPILKK